MTKTLHLKSVKCQGLKEFEYTSKRCENLRMKIGDLIKKAREAIGYTQEDAAKLACISQKSWSKIEKGVIKKPRNLSLIESILGLPSGFLTNQESNILQFPQPLMARCPLLNWESATRWPEQKEDISKNVDIKSVASKVILGANSYALKVEDFSMTNYGGQALFKKEESYLIVDTDKKYETGDYVIVKLKGSDKAFCKRYAKEGDTEYLFANLSGIDPIKINENIIILGVVVVNFNILKD